MLTVLVVFDGENPLFFQRKRFSDNCPIVTENVNDAEFFTDADTKRKGIIALSMILEFGDKVFSQVQPGIGHKKDSLKFSELVAGS